LPHEKFTKEHAKEIINRIKNISKEAPPENLACMLAITYENNPSEEIAQGFRKNWDFIASEVKLSFTLPLSWQAKNDYTWQSEYGNGLEFLRIAIEHVDLEQLRNPQDAQDFRTKYIRIIYPKA